MSVSYEMRTLDAFAYEKQAPAELRRRGWDVAAIGMSQLPETMRGHLIKIRDSYGRPCLWRWLPDLLASTARFGRPRACLVDVKNVLTSKPATPNYSIELTALETYRALEEEFHLPVVMLASGGAVLTIHTAFNRGGGRIQDGATADGSGTAFMLVRKMYAVSLDDYFGPPLELAAAP